MPAVSLVHPSSGTETRTDNCVKLSSTRTLWFVSCEVVQSPGADTQNVLVHGWEKRQGDEWVHAWVHGEKEQMNEKQGLEQLWALSMGVGLDCCSELTLLVCVLLRKNL